MNAHRLPARRLRFGSLALAVSCCGLVGSRVSLDRTSASAGIVRFDACELTAGTTGDEVTLLRKAYAHLYIGNHDYKGHRVAAMKAVAAACDLLGSDIRGDANDKETQPASDDQLKAAQELIEQAQQLAENANQPKVVGHLKKAVNEINTALSIK